MIFDFLVICMKIDKTLYNFIKKKKRFNVRKKFNGENSNDGLPITMKKNKADLKRFERF